MLLELFRNRIQVINFAMPMVPEQVLCGVPEYVALRNYIWLRFDDAIEKDF